VFCTLAWWEVGFSKKTDIAVYAIIIEGILSSISLLSRGMYIFHVVPLLFVVGKKNFLVWISLRKKIIFIFLFVCGVIITLTAVNNLRNFYYSGVKFDISSLIELNKGEVKFGARKIAADYLKKFSFAIDRWVG